MTQDQDKYINLKLMIKINKVLMNTYIRKRRLISILYRRYNKKNKLKLQLPLINNKLSILLKKYLVFNKVMYHKKLSKIMRQNKKILRFKII